MTQVNMKQAVAGSKVHFRCGGSAVVDRFEVFCNNTRVILHREDDFIIGVYEADGTYINGKVHPFDIIRIEPPQFKWEDVKNGHAFKDRDWGLCWYVGKSPITNDEIILEAESGYVLTEIKSDLTRAPEHDKVQP